MRGGFASRLVRMLLLAGASVCVMTAAAVAAIGDNWTGSATMGADGQLVYFAGIPGNASAIWVYSPRTFSFTLTNQSSSAEAYVVTAVGDVFGDQNGTGMFSYRSDSVTMRDAAGSIVCSSGELTVGGHWQGSSFGQLIFNRRKCPLVGTQYLNFYRLPDGSTAAYLWGQG
jgi:hypothetical protein